MFIYNFKVNGSKIYKIFFSIMVIFLILIVCIVTFKIFNGANSLNTNDPCIPKNNVITLNTSNYTNILKTIHENIDDYVGIKIKFTGYVYRVLDINENQFILARDMIISSDRQSVVVGFLSEFDKANELTDGTWIEVSRKNYKRRLSWCYAYFKNN